MAINRREFLSAFAAAALGTDGRNLLSRPNILFILADNFSWNHMGSYGCKAIETPHFDRVAREGVLFTHAFCNAPSCSPSRAAMLTGQDIWRLEEGGNLWGTLPKHFGTYTDLLQSSGYWTGYTGKGYKPGSAAAGGWSRNPVADRFSDFGAFLHQRPAGSPFYFWYGGEDVNQYSAPVVTDGVDLEHFEIPPFLPDCKAVRDDFYKYFQRLRQFDLQIGMLLDQLDETGESQNTIVVVAADNGMDLPRGYPNLYDSGTREFLAVRWPSMVPAGRAVDDLVLLSDLAPTFLAAAGVSAPVAMTAKNLLPVLASHKSGQTQGFRSFVALGRERHAWARAGGLGYPMRAIRTDQYLYIRNYEPDRWPAGDPDFPARAQGYYGDVDRCESKWYILEHRDEAAIEPYFDRIFGKRPSEELFDVRSDPDQLKNLADDSAYAAVKHRLAEKLKHYLKKTGDPRELGKTPKWDSYPYYNPPETTIRPDPKPGPHHGNS